MVPKADNMPKLQKRNREKYKDHTSDQGRPLVELEDSMEMDKVRTHSIERSGTLRVTGRVTYAPKDRKTLKFAHGHHRSYYIFFITGRTSAPKQKITPAQSKKILTWDK